jgi:patatin-like phospholipase
MSKKTKTIPSKNSTKNGAFRIEKTKISISSDDTVRIESKKVRPQRALILQGGGALGAYEAGVFRSLAEKLSREDGKNGEKDRPLFDIVAGSSIGAVNAALLVSYVVQNKSWIGSDNMLYQFWDDLSNPSWWAPRWVKDNPIFIRWRQFWIDSVLDNDLNGDMWNYWKGLREIWNKYYYNNYPIEIEKDIKYERLLGFPIPYLKDDWPYFDWIGRQFHDRTDYDIQAANTTTDYIDLTKAIIDLGLKHTNNSSSFQSDLMSILNSQTRSKGRNRMYRKYGELLAGRFRIIKVGYIERIDDGNTIFGKAFEFSYRTVNDLRDSGYRDASENMRYD